ncbi:hypothetical protein SS50377_22822 [Spironucleus salmonicida]|uniref:Uncharacterized protein n=1 Tax=Spironucleus salmonicida TaxID=348837 RepID=A0A9P8RZU5_9EUKA|nr:hypothetical protein SS50377_22822 [Spironucleus salmonicida]
MRGTARSPHRPVQGMGRAVMRHGRWSDTQYPLLIHSLRSARMRLFDDLPFGVQRQFAQLEALRVLDLGNLMKYFVAKLFYYAGAKTADQLLAFYTGLLDLGGQYHFAVLCDIFGTERLVMAVSQHNFPFFRALSGVFYGPASCFVGVDDFEDQLITICRIVETLAAKAPSVAEGIRQVYRARETEVLRQKAFKGYRIGGDASPHIEGRQFRGRWDIGYLVDMQRPSRSAGGGK